MATKKDQWEEIPGSPAAEQLLKEMEERQEKERRAIRPRTLDEIRSELTGVKQPGVWPPPQSETIAMLGQATNLVANGKPVRMEFVDGLRRMLSSVEERFDMVEVVVGHHQLHRLQKMLASIEQIEAVALNPDQIIRYDADQLLKLLQIMYGEAASAIKFVQGVNGSYNPDQVDAVIDPAQLSKQLQAKEVVGKVSITIRRQVREALARSLATMKAPSAAPKPKPRAKSRKA